MQSIRLSIGALFAALALGAPCTTTQAQELAPGARVRVKSSQVVAPIIGSYQGMRHDTVVVIAEGAAAQLWTFNSSAVDRLEVSVGLKPGNRGPTTKWALIGVGAGALLGWITAITLEGTSDTEYDDIVSAIIGAGVGAGVGAYYGYRKLDEHWAAVPIPRRVGFLPTRNGVKLGFSASF